MSAGADRLAIVAGLTGVDPAAYGGWDGYCPGCDLDARRMASLSRAARFDASILLLNGAAQRPTARGLLMRAADVLIPGDLLFLLFSGHGSQMPDLSGDEPDQLDETTCWYDGEMVDDEFWKLLCEFRLGVRILVITDSCDSGSPIKLRPTHARPRNIPLRLRPRGKAYEPMPEMQAQVIHFGACDDGRTAKGYSTGGVFTNALLAAWHEAHPSWVRRLFGARAKPLSYRHWFAAAAARMPADQTPVYAEHGPVMATFRDAEALS